MFKKKSAHKPVKPAPKETIVPDLPEDDGVGELMEEAEAVSESAPAPNETAMELLRQAWELHGGDIIGTHGTEAQHWAERVKEFLEHG